MTTRDGSKAFIESDSIAWQSAGGGIRRKILGYDKTMMMVAVEFEKGSVASIHRHIHTQVTFVERGSFEVQIGGEKKVLSKGDCFFALPDVDHGVVAREDGCLVDVFSPIREEFLGRSRNSPTGTDRVQTDQHTAHHRSYRNSAAITGCHC